MPGKAHQVVGLFALHLVMRKLTAVQAGEKRKIRGYLSQSFRLLFNERRKGFLQIIRCGKVVFIQLG